MYAKTKYFLFLLAAVLASCVPAHAQFNSAYTGAQVEALLDKVAATNAALLDQNDINSLEKLETHIEADLQPYDADLAALAALTGTNTLYYRSAADTWTAVTIGDNLSFTSGTLSATGGGGGTGDLSEADIDTIAKINAFFTGEALLSQAATEALVADKQDADADLAALAALTGTNTLYYRSGADTWTAVTIGDNLDFTSGTLSATSGGGGGDLSAADIDTLDELNTILTDADLMGETAILALFDDTVLTGAPTAPTPVTGATGTEIATAAFVRAVIEAITTLNLVYSSSTAAGQPLDADHSYSGPAFAGRNAGATISFGQPVRYDFASGEYLLTDADVLATARAAGIAASDGTDGNPILVVTHGDMRDDSWNWSEGPIYTSGTAGGLTQTPPTTSGGGVHEIGFALTADTIRVQLGPIIEIE